MKKSEEKLFNDAVEEFRKIYEKALTLNFIRNPLTYALYQTWKNFDNRMN